ncbi:acyl carrier protein [Tengunoibacter tsumagoiensis]|uniref:Aminoacyl carrier protein n=1 Tax=Tengunoibacter tsumagoiensis TaxID=2014871 RepID=A0A401ZY04_9CHLR|nr:acyl carrier protein [Tengunoibacter tsumagoiensis]GCE11736.1 aminoacyl carrier protein [Tengunoibacter tsumagoiensis]
MREQIRTILQENAHLPVAIATLSDDANLYDSGMSSHSTVNVMLALEDEFDIEFPPRLLKRGVFSSVLSIESAVRELVGATEAV